MAIFITGMPCLICHCPIKSDDNSQLLPSFITNQADPLFMFSDGVFHAACFHRHPLAKQALARLEQHQIHGTKGCSLCHQKIDYPDEYFGLGHLTDETSHPLHRFNYAQYHRTCLQDSPKRHEVLQLFQSLRGNEQYAEEWIDAYIEDLKDPVGIMMKRRAKLRRSLNP